MSLSISKWKASRADKKIVKALRKQGIRNPKAYLDPDDANYGYIDWEALKSSSGSEHACPFCNVPHNQTYWKQKPINIARQKTCRYWRLAVAALEAFRDYLTADITTYDISVLLPKPLAPHIMDLSLQPFIMQSYCGRSWQGSLAVHLTLDTVPKGMLGRTINDRLELAKSWVEDCNSKLQHDCAKRTDSRLPDRVLDVNAEDLGLDIRLIDNCEDRSPYITLSHCWGKGQPVKTEKASLKQHLDRIAVDALPMSFQHAVLVTRALGVRYLWIDSLCIVQDDVKDWHTQSRWMGSIYTHAYLTIAASSAPDCDTGFLVEKDWVRPVTLVHDGIESTAHVQRNFAHPSHPGGVLDTRGWFFQEWLLSRRILWFDDDEMTWTCVRRACCECGAVDLTDKPIHLGEPFDRFFMRKTFRGMLQRSSYNNEYEAWYALVNAYVEKDLTYSTDRLPAFTAIAERLKELTGDVYLAGIWKKDILRGLGWSYRDINTIINKRHLTPRELSVPTWSWACSGTRSWVYNAVQGSSGFDRDIETMVYKREFLGTEVTCVDYHLLSNNEFGPAIGKIELRGLIAMALLTCPSDLSGRSRDCLTLVSHESAIPQKSSRWNPLGYSFVRDCHLQPEQRNLSGLLDVGETNTVQRCDRDSAQDVVDALVVLVPLYVDVFKTPSTIAPVPAFTRVREVLVIAPSSNASEDNGVYQRIGLLHVNMDEEWETLLGVANMSTVTIE